MQSCLLPDDELTAQHCHYSFIRSVNKSQAQVAPFCLSPPAPPFFSSSSSEMGHGIHLLMSLSWAIWGLLSVFFTIFNCKDFKWVDFVPWWLMGSWVACHWCVCTVLNQFYIQDSIKFSAYAHICVWLYMYTSVSISSTFFIPQLDIQSSAQSLTMPPLTGRFVSSAPELVFARWSLLVLIILLDKLTEPKG